MNPRLAFAVLLACALLAVFSQAGCYNGASIPTASPSPIASISPAPDTLYVQDATSRTVRVYKNASAVNGPAPLAESPLPTSDNGNPDVVHCSCASDVLWYPNQTTNQIDVWTMVATKGGKNPDFTVPLSNQEGAIAYDSLHNFLYVAQNNTNAILVYGSALTLGQGGNTSPIATVTLNFTDTSVANPHPQEFLYDAAHDRLFLSDNGAVVAEFDTFGAGAGVSHTATPNRYISGLFSTNGLAYDSNQDVLFVAEPFGNRVVVVKHATTSPDGAHAPNISGFAVGPSGIAYDTPRGILFVYNGPEIEVLPSATSQSGAFAAIPNRRIIFDSHVSSISGFGLYVDTTH